MYLLLVAAGRVGKDPQFHTTEKGSSVCRFSLACDYVWNSEKKTEWLNCVCFGKTAELAAKLHKGSAVHIQGRPNTTKYEKDGRTVWSTSTVVERLTFLDPRPAQSGAGEDDSAPF